MSGVIISGFYPNNYMNLGRCETSITVPTNFTVMLVANDFNTELCCDYLEVCSFYIVSVCLINKIFNTHTFISGTVLKLPNN